MQEALESALAQTYPLIEVLISDDASTDATEVFLKQITDPRVVTVRRPVNGGMVANYNTALHAATSEFIVMLNDDDRLEPTAIEKLVGAFLNPPKSLPPSEIGISWCPYINVDSNDKRLWKSRGAPSIETSIDLIEGLYNGTRGIIISGVMHRTADSLALGGFDPEARGLADALNWGKIALHHRYSVCVNEPLMLYRVHSGAMTKEQDADFWRQTKEREVGQYVSILRGQGNEAGARRLLKAGNHSIANSITTILMRRIGSPGWPETIAKIVWRHRDHMLTPFVFIRFVKDGWKLFRLKKRLSEKKS